MTTREWGSLAGWGTVVFGALWFISGSTFFAGLCGMSCAAWAGLGVKESIEKYVSPADRDLDARLQADTRAAYLRDLIERGERD